MSVYVTIILASCISSRHHLIQKSLYCARIVYIAVLRTSDCHTQQCSDHGAHAQERHTCHSLHQITHGEFSCNKTSSECSCDGTLEIHSILGKGSDFQARLFPSFFAIKLLKLDVQFQSIDSKNLLPSMT